MSQPTAEVDERSPYAMARDAIGALVDAAVDARRIEAMHQALQFELIFATVMAAVHCETVFVAPPGASGGSRSPIGPREFAMRAVTAELATALHLPERTMTQRIDEAMVLCTRLPATLAAMREGAVSVQHARVVIDELSGLTDSPELVAELDRQLASVAADLTAAKLRRTARRLREQLAPGALAERHEAALAKRHVAVEPARDGMAWLRALLPATDAYLIHDRIDGLAHEVRDAEAAGPEADSPCAPRTLDQIRADVARDLLLDGQASGSSTIRPTVHVTVPVLTLLGLAEQPAELDGYGPIDAETARRLAAHAPSFTRLLTHPISGTVLEVDRTGYRPPADLKRWLEVRDQTCQFPGCNRRAVRCEVDHTVAHASGGATAFENLVHLCAFHHQLKHGSLWNVRRTRAGALKWTSPLGRTHVTQRSADMPAEPPGHAPPSQPFGVISGGAIEPSAAPEPPDRPPF